MRSARGGHPRWAKVRRDLWLHRGRSALVVLAIAVGIVGAGAVLDAWSLLRHVTRDQFLASNPPSATVRTSSVDAAVLARVRAVPGVQAAEARRTVVASALVDGAWRTALLFAADDLAAERIGRVDGVAGAWPPPDGALVVEHSSVDSAHAAVGAPLTLAIGDRPSVALPVAGVARDVGLAPGWMEHVVYVFVTPATLRRLGVDDAADELRIVASEREDRDAVRRVVARVEQVLVASGRSARGVDVPVPGRHVHAAQMGSLLFTQEAFGVLALLMSGFLVVNLMMALLARQRREIGILKTLGASTAQVGALYLALAAVLGAVACVVALPLAWLLGRAYATFTADLLDFDLTGARVPVAMLALQAAAGLLLPVIAAAVPVAIGCRVPVGDALRDAGVPLRTAARLSRAQPPGGRWRRAAHLALRNAARRPQRLALTVTALALGGAVFVAALDLRVAILGAVDLVFAPQRFDLAVRLERSAPPARLEALARGVPGVRAAEAWIGARAMVPRADGLPADSFALVAPPRDTRLLRLDAAAMRALAAGEGVVVNRRLLDEQPSLRAGTAATLFVAGRPVRWPVRAVVDSGVQPQAWAARELVEPVVGGGAGTLVLSTTSADARRVRDVASALRERLAADGSAVASTTISADQRRAIEDHLLLVASFLGGMGVLVIVVGGLGLASTMGLAVLERRREIGVLRAIGARHGTIAGLLLGESLAVGLLSFGVAVPLSLPMSLALGEAFARIMLRVPVVWVPEPTAVLRWLLVVLVVSTLASLGPAWRALRQPAREALAYE